MILDIEKPGQPRIDQVFNAGGCINDLHDVKLGITYVSEFAYLADGKNGLRVVQLTSPETPGNDGFSPRPTPRLIATYPMPHGGEALAISEGRGPRPGGGRERQPDRRLRPRRRPAARAARSSRRCTCATAASGRSATTRSTRFILRPDPSSARPSRRPQRLGEPAEAVASAPGSPAGPDGWGGRAR